MRLAPTSAALHAGWVPRIVLDFEPPMPDAPELPANTSDLVYFLSWAFSARYGGSHEMAVASLLLRGEFGIDLRPLLTFADRNIEEPEDRDVLEAAWQDAAPLADCCAKVAAALSSGEPRFGALVDEYPALASKIGALGDGARFAAGRGSRIRVTFELEGVS